jgi:hypothetical protein
MRKEQSCAMKLARRAAWSRTGGNASYVPALLSARVGAEDPRYPGLSGGCGHSGSRGIFSVSPRPISAVAHFDLG